MAYFRATGGPGGGAGTPTITVTYSSQFYNKTMTCSNGTKTYTKTTTSSGSTEFKVNDEGTWTITCNGVSRTVDVVLEYTTQMAITKTITVYSAASDTVSFTDATGAKTVTTDTSGRGSVAITFIPPSASITFTSRVAKNPNNLSQAYSKTITIDSNTTSIYVMPNKTLYWWGYVGNAEDCTSANGWSYGGSGITMSAPTHNTDNIYFETNTSSIDKAFGSKSPVTGTVNAIIQAVSVNGGESVIFNDNTTKAVKSNWTGATNGITNTSRAKYSRNVTNAYPYVEVYNTGRSGKLYAMWYE